MAFWIYENQEKIYFLLDMFIFLQIFGFYSRDPGPLKRITNVRAKLWIEKTNDLVDIETDISRNLKGLLAIEIANAVGKKSLAGVETAIRFFETQPRREREPDR